MKPRNAEAARLEADYLARVKAALAAHEPGEVDEITASLREHIEEEVSRLGNAEAGLAQMANILERLGSPETYGQDDVVRQEPEPLPPVSKPTRTIAGAATSAKRLADVVDKVWLAYLIDIAGFYVPVINLGLCSIIGNSIIACVPRSLPRGEEDAIRSAGKFCEAAVLLSLVGTLVAFLALTSSGFAIVGLPIAMLCLACRLIAFWKICGRVADAVTLDGDEDVGEMIYSRRTAYIASCIFVVIMGIVIACILVLGGMVRHANEVWWLGYAILPIHWIFGWQFVLKPLGHARDSLRRRAFTPDLATASI